MATLQVLVVNVADFTIDEAVLKHILLEGASGLLHAPRARLIVLFLQLLIVCLLFEWNQTSLLLIKDVSISLLQQVQSLSEFLSLIFKVILETLAALRPCLTVTQVRGRCCSFLPHETGLRWFSALVKPV